MKIQESYVKELFVNEGILTLKGTVVSTPDEALKAYSKMDGADCVLKADVALRDKDKLMLSEVINEESDVKSIADEMLKSQIAKSDEHDAMNGISSLILEEHVVSFKELFLSVFINRRTSNIEISISNDYKLGNDFSEKSLKDVVNVHVPDLGELPSFVGRKISYGMNLTGDLEQNMTSFLKQVYRFFIEYDCIELNIHPLLITEDGRIISSEVSMEVDDSALFRHEGLRNFQDESQKNSLQKSASDEGLSYVAMEGDIGTIVNGAGLSMATCDLIKSNGGSPHNFMDIGGGASIKKINAALTLLSKNSSLKVILINIFGGITKCDVVAEGVVQWCKISNVEIPIIARFEGTNVAFAKKIVEESDTLIILEDKMIDAVKKSIKLAKSRKKSLLKNSIIESVFSTKEKIVKKSNNE